MVFPLSVQTQTIQVSHVLFSLSEAKCPGSSRTDLYKRGINITSLLVKEKKKAQFPKCQTISYRGKPKCPVSVPKKKGKTFKITCPFLQLTIQLWSRALNPYVQRQCNPLNLTLTLI